MSRLALFGGEKVRVEPWPVHPILGDEEKTRVRRVLETGLLSGFIANAQESFFGGPEVKELEASIKSYFGVEHAIAVNSATAGLHAALAAVGVGPGDEVIVPPYTMSATATAILMQNAIPVFADIDSEIFCLDPKSVREKITPRTKAILVVHLFGQSADMDAIFALAAEADLAVIEDCAQAPGATYRGKAVGTFGQMGVFSFNQHKTITTGEGGFIITDDDELALRTQLVRNHGEVIVEPMGVERIDNIIGWNYRMTELEAAVGIAQFEKLDMLTNHRVSLADYLKKKLARFPGLSLPVTRPGNNHVYFVFPIKFDEQAVGIDRDLFVKALNAEGVPFGAGYVRPIYLEPAYQQRIGYGAKGCPFSCAFYEGRIDYDKGLCPVAERLYEKELLLTGLCRYPMTESDMDDIAAAFGKIYDNIDELRQLNGQAAKA